MERLEETVVKKRAIESWYDELLDGLDKIARQPSATANAGSIYWVYGIILSGVGEIWMWGGGF